MESSASSRRRSSALSRFTSVLGNGWLNARDSVTSVAALGRVEELLCTGIEEEEAREAAGRVDEKSGFAGSVEPRGGCLLAEEVSLEAGTEAADADREAGVADAGREAGVADAGREAGAADAGVAREVCTLAAFTLSLSKAAVLGCTERVRCRSGGGERRCDRVLVCSSAERGLTSGKSSFCVKVADALSLSWKALVSSGVRCTGRVVR
mmetsp:Transcript_7451/g.22924  ORF Transcript_7451/g.22924 Transcript_7451/m.22924 type:complete len:209 (+) Transcript_7451:365-991(+)